MHLTREHLEMLYQLTGDHESCHSRLLRLIVLSENKSDDVKSGMKTMGPQRGLSGKVSSRLIKMNIIRTDTDLVGSFCRQWQICKAQPSDRTLYPWSYRHSTSVFFGKRRSPPIRHSQGNLNRTDCQPHRAGKRWPWLQMWPRHRWECLIDQRNGKPGNQLARRYRHHRYYHLLRHRVQVNSWVIKKKGIIILKSLFVEQRVEFQFCVETFVGLESLMLLIDIKL